jgi:hypothetical protein
MLAVRTGPVPSLPSTLPSPLPYTFVLAQLDNRIYAGAPATGKQASLFFVSFASVWHFAACIAVPVGTWLVGLWCNYRIVCARLSWVFQIGVCYHYIRTRIHAFRLHPMHTYG